VLGPASTNEKFCFDADGPVRFRAVEISSGLRPVTALRAAWRLHGYLRGAHVVHAHGLRAAIVSAVALGRFRAASARRRPALVVTLHNAALGSRFRMRLLTFVMRRLAVSADELLVVSPDLVEALRPVVAGRALVAAAVRQQTRDRASTRAALGIPDGERLVLAVGRLHRQKGFDVLIEAAAALRGRAITTAIAGAGPELGNLQRQIDKAHVDVGLLGDRADIGDLLHAADVVVMPSRWEGWPLAAAEVLAAGRPFVATKVGGLGELVGDAALLVEPGDAQALAAAIEHVVDDPALADELVAKARARAGELPGNDDVVRQLLACYERVSR
jgi:glycosyltransferase involved in cell wall biosynthesis